MEIKSNLDIASQHAQNLRQEAPAISLTTQNDLIYAGKDAATNTVDEIKSANAKLHQIMHDFSKAITVVSENLQAVDESAGL